MKYVNQTFRRLFDRSGLTVYRFAERSGMDEKYVRNLLNGKRSNPSMVTVLKLHRTLASEPEQLATYPELAQASTACLVFLGGFTVRFPCYVAKDTPEVFRAHCTSDLLLKAMLRDAATDYQV